MKYQTKTEKQTFNLGKNFAKKLQGGEVLILQGDLGSGKTVFTKGLAEGLDIKKVITSPTFVLFKVYQVRGHKSIKELVHVDCYRVQDGQEVIDAGLSDYLFQAGVVVVVEWGERLPDDFRKNALKVKFQMKGEERVINL